MTAKEYQALHAKKPAKVIKMPAAAKVKKAAAPQAEVELISDFILLLRVVYREKREICSIDDINNILEENNVKLKLIKIE